MNKTITKAFLDSLNRKYFCHYDLSNGEDYSCKMTGFFENDVLTIVDYVLYKKGGKS